MDRWMLRFHASMVGSRRGLGRAIDETALPGFGSRPLAGIGVTGGRPGPLAIERGNPCGLSANALGVFCLRQVLLMPGPQVQCQVRGCAPGVLSVEGDPLLELLRVRGGAGVTLVSGDLTEHKRREPQPAGLFAWTRCRSHAKVEL